MNQLKTNDFSIDWLSSDSHYLFDESHPEARRFAALASKMPFYPGHIYLFTSGFQKIALLSKHAFLISAKSVNRHLKCEKKGRWLIPLPLFHVGGLSVLARAFCGGFACLYGKKRRQAKEFCSDLGEKNISYTSLVPAQVYDLVTKNLRPPECLEFALVGGGSLSAVLYKKARALGWPLLPTYGMTEVCSQIATATRASLRQSIDSGISKAQIATAEKTFLRKKEFPDLKILSHINIRLKQGILEIRTPSLLTGYFDLSLKTFLDPKTKGGWFPTCDKGELVSVSGKAEAPEPVGIVRNCHENPLAGKGARGGDKNQKAYLILKGRLDDTIKIKGYMVSLKKLSEKLQKIREELSLQKDFCLLALPSERKGCELALVTDSFNLDEALKVLNQFNKNLPIYEKAVSLYMIKKIPRTGLLKVNKTTLKKQLSVCH